MSSNSAVLIRLYPNKHTEKLLMACCRYRNRFYNALAYWWNSTRRACSESYARFCEANESDEAQKEFSKTLPWPSKKLSKEGLNDTCLRVMLDKVPSKMRFACTHDFTDIVKKGKDKGLTKNYGDVFRLNAVYMPAMFGESPACASVSSWCKEDFARAVNMTFASTNKRDAKGTPSIKPRRMSDGMTFKVSMASLEIRRDSKDRISAIRVPFLSGKKRKSENENAEWIKCSLSDSLFERAQSVSAITIQCRNGKWFGSLSVFSEQKPHVDTGLECGIDLGVKTAATIAENRCCNADASDDRHAKLDMPVERIRELEKRIDYLKRQQSRRIKVWMKQNADGAAKGLSMTTAKGDRAHNAVAVYTRNYQSNSYRKTEKRIASLNMKIANIRKNWHEQTSRYLADRYDFIGLEDLNVSGMLKNSRLARSITRTGFYNFRMAVQRKAGIDRVTYINRFAPSSKACSHCGYRNNDLKLDDREWTCPQCGTHHDRDENAASNIRPSRQRETESRMPQRG